MFTGLFLYESVLIILGTILFIVLLGLIVFCVLKKRDYKLLLTGLLLPVLMIGFPSFQKIEYDKLKVELSHKSKELEARPNDAGLKAEVQKKVEEIQSRPIEQDAQAQTAVARAEKALNNDTKALEAADKALKIEPKSSEAQSLKTEITEIVVQKEIKSDQKILEQKVEQLEKSPNNITLKKEVEDKSTDLKSRASARSMESKPEIFATVARAEKASGKTEQADNTAKEAIKLNPAIAPAVQPYLRQQAPLILAAPAPSLKNKLGKK